MKKYISGKVYNTDTAKFLGEYQTDYKSSFSWFHEQLYRKRTGEFFLWGEGHADSKYAVSCGQNTYAPGEAITPLSYEEAKEWAERRLSTDEYDAIFGVPEDEKGKLNVSLSAKHIEMLRNAATKSGESMSAIVERLIEEHCSLEE